VQRDGPTSDSLTVYFSTGGTATSGSDYSSIGGSVTIPAGSSSTTITVTPIDDAAAEVAVYSVKLGVCDFRESVI
jgi:hypothetical protein